MAERVFTLPDLGEGLEEAVVTAWLVAEGDTIELNQPFVEIETAKATVEIPSPFAGRIAKLHAVAGATLAVGAPLVTFEVEESETDDSMSRAATATPAVRRLAKDLRVDLGSVVGTGPAGRVTRDDVERAASVPPVGDFELVPVTPVRRAIARNLEEIARIPQVTTFRTVDCTELDALRRELDVSPLPVFVRALAETCHEHPWINASWTDEGIRLHHLVHVGLATDTDRGLVVPVLRDARSQTIGAIAAEVARLAGSARANTLTPQDMSGATIAVTNTGSYGSEAGTSLLHPGHVVTIALGVIAPRALVVGGAVEPRPACTLSLTFDHRVLDGATVGRALGALVDLLESREHLGALPH